MFSCEFYKIFKNTFLQNTSGQRFLRSTSLTPETPRWALLLTLTLTLTLYDGCFQGDFSQHLCTPGDCFCKLVVTLKFPNSFQLKVADSEYMNFIMRALLWELKKVDNNCGILRKAFQKGLSKLHTFSSSVNLAIQFVKNRQKLNSFSLLKSLKFGDKILQGTVYSR